MSHTLRFASWLVALPLASLHAQTIVSTKAVCVNSYLSDPNCWENAVSPINTADLLYSINDSINNYNIYFDVPNTLNTFNSSKYEVFVHRDLTVLGLTRLRFLTIQPDPGGPPVTADMGSFVSPSFAQSVTLWPRSALTLRGSEVSIIASIRFRETPVGDPGGPASLTIDTPTVVNTDLSYVTENPEPISIRFPSTTSIGLRDPFELGLGPVTIDAPLLEEINDESVEVYGTDPGFSFNAPSLQRVNSIAFRPADTSPTGFNTPPLDVELPAYVHIDQARTQPLIITQLGRVRALRIPASYKNFSMSFPNLVAADDLALGECGGTVDFPDLLQLDNLSVFPTRNRVETAPPLSLLMPMADYAPTPVGPDPLSPVFKILGGIPGSYDRVDLRSFTSLPPGAKIDIPEGATVRFDSLAEIDDAELQINASFEAPFPTITSLDRSVFRIAGDTEVTITDPIIEIDDYEPFIVGPGAQMNFAATESTQLMVWDDLQLVALDGSIEMPALAAIEPDSGNPPTLEARVLGPGARVSLPALTGLARLRINFNMSTTWFADPAAVGTPEIVLDVADVPYIASTSAFLGRLNMPAQSSLTSEHTLRGNGFLMPGVQTVDNAVFTLAANPDSPFLLDLSGATQFTATTINATGSGTIDIPTVTPDLNVIIDLGTAGGPVRFTGNVLSASISGPGTIQIEGDLLPPANNTGFPPTIEMIGPGQRLISPLRSNVGLDTARARRGLVVGGPGTHTKLHLTPRPDSDFDGAFYLGKFTELAEGFRIRPGSALYLDGVPAYLWRYDPETDSEHYVPLAGLIPPGARCVEFDGGLLCLRDCPPDLNNDNVADFGDISRFVELFLAGDPDADVNNDGITDFGDIQAFVAAFLAGC